MFSRLPSYSIKKPQIYFHISLPYNTSSLTTFQQSYNTGNSFSYILNSISITLLDISPPNPHKLLKTPSIISSFRIHSPNFSTFFFHFIFNSFPCTRDPVFNFFQRILYFLPNCVAVSFIFKFALFDYILCSYIFLFVSFIPYLSFILTEFCILIPSFHKLDTDFCGSCNIILFTLSNSFHILFLLSTFL